MKVGYAFVPHFAVAVEQQRRPDLVGKALVVGGLPHERCGVFAASPEAEEAGVRPGMTLRQAEYLCPAAIFLPLEREYYAQVQARLLAALETVSPAVELDGWGAAYLDAAGLELLYSGDEGFAGQVAQAAREQVGLAAQVAVGPSKLVARLAARLARQGQPVLIGPGEGRAFLADLPVGLLPLAAETEERLRRLGIRTIGAFLRLPRPVLAERLGRDAVAAHRAAAGDDGGRVVPRSPVATLHRAVALDDPAASPAALQPLLARLLSALAAQLRARGQACQRIDIRLDGEDGQVVAGTTLLKEATTIAADLQRAAEALVERLWRGGGDGVVQVDVTLSGLGAEQGKQLQLLQSRLEEQRRRERLERALAHLRRRFGEHVRQGIRNTE